MKNVLIWGLNKDISRFALQALEKENLISIKVWFGEPRTEVVTHNWLEIIYSGMEKEDLVQCSEDIYQEMYQHLHVFMDLLSRTFYFRDKSIHEYLNVFNLSIYYLYGLLMKNQINLIIFDNIPHDAPNYMLYNLAKILKIKTLIVSQSLFPDKFFYVSDVNDFGLFEDFHGQQLGLEKVNLAKQYEKEIFYMNEPTLEAKLNKKMEAVLYFSKWKQKRIAILKKATQKYENVADFFWQNSYKKLLKYHLNKFYNQRLKDCFQDDVDLSAKFVYFPLHLQPEMTTSALGGVYCDQLLAIERLSKWIPEDWVIYVKENPKQSSFMRGEYFFHRLMEIPKVNKVGKDFNTYDLIKNSQFVSTITGTAGWEAISGGKNVVVFGRAWYLKLPGVFKYSGKLLLQDVLDYRIDHHELEKQVACLLAKLGTGLVDQEYISMLPNFDQQENNQKLLDFFRSHVVDPA